MKLFQITQTISTSFAMQFTSFILECKKEKENALLLINANIGADLDAISQIIETCKDSKVHISAIGMGKLSPLAAIIFSMADVRILLPETKVILNIKFAKYYQRFKIPKNVFKKNAIENIWEIESSDFEQFEITNCSSDNWMKLIEESLGNNTVNFSPFFEFDTDFNEITTLEVIKFLVQCKMNKTDATILLHSPGGTWEQLKLIIYAYKMSEVKLRVIGIGRVASCAAILFCIADTRILVPNTTFLIHFTLKIYDSPSANLYLPFNQLEKDYKALLASNNQMIELLSQKTELSPDIITQKCSSGDWILTKKELKTFKIVNAPSKGRTNIIVKIIS